MAQFAQRLGLDLADALSGDIEILSHLLQGVIGLFIDTKPHLQDLLLPGRQGGQYFSGLLRKVFQPTSQIRVLRTYWRQRAEHVQAAASCIQRMQKALTQMWDELYVRQNTGLLVAKPLAH